MKMKGAQILIKALEEQDVEVIFGYPGGAVLDIYDAIIDSSINHILVRHEQGGVHAASGYARVSGKVGVCLATSGPGAINTVTGIATAYMDSIPIVVITGQVEKKMIGTDAFQEVDIKGITTPITKHNYLVQNVEDVSRIIAEAFHIASTGRPGPVLIDIPLDILAQIDIFKSYKKIKMRNYNPNFHGHSTMINKAKEIIGKSDDIIICVGGGVIHSQAFSEVNELVRLTNGKVVSTLMGLGAYPGNDEAFIGMIGTYGTKKANQAVQYCDCLISLGMRFSNRTIGNVKKFSPNSKIIHIDIDPAEIGKTVNIDVPIVGDIKIVLSELIKKLKKLKKYYNYCNNRNKSKIEGTTEFENKLQKDKLTPTWVLNKINEIVSKDTIITTDVGQHQMWTARNYCFNMPRTLITSGGLGTMGYGIPAAVGAQIANSESLVIVITGDGSFQMGIHELGTIAELGLPIKILIFNNQSLGMVRQLQYFYKDKRYCGVDFKKGLDFMGVAKAYGAKGYQIKNMNQAQDVLKKALNNDSFTIIECSFSSKELVIPIVKKGKGLNEMSNV